MTGKVPVARVQGEGAFVPFQIERMNAIPHIKTMAGSPDADRKSRSASSNLAHGFRVPDFHALCEPMKEDQKCSIFMQSRSTGVDDPSSLKPENSPVRPTGLWLQPTARPSC